MDGAISILALSIVAAFCFVGVFSSWFDDTLMQRIGMSCIAIWSVARIDTKIETMDTEPVHLLLHVGLAVYAVGTAVKIHREHRRG